MEKHRKGKTGDNKIVVKKYPNRRLYLVNESRYITLDELKDIIKDSTDVHVVDAKTGEDLTHATMVQIIFEQESKGYGVLPLSFLKKIIGFYDDSLKAMLPPYLEASMEAFQQNHQKMREYMESRFKEMFPMTNIEDMQKKNIELFQSAMDMMKQWNPVTSYLNKEKDKDKK